MSLNDMLKLFSLLSCINTTLERIRNFLCLCSVYNFYFNEDVIIDSALTLGVRYFLSLSLSVALSVCLFVTNIASSFFVSRWN